MEVLCGGIVILIVVAFPIWAIVQILWLQTREEELTERLKRLEKVLRESSSSISVSPSAADAPAPQPPPLPKSIARENVTTRWPENSSSETFPTLKSEDFVVADAATSGTATEEPGNSSRDPDFSPTKIPAPPLNVPAAMSLERRIVWSGVWVGAIALVLAGVYLVKEAVEKGWLGPAVRVYLTAGAGILALGIGEFLRRADRHIAHGITAAGVALLYASLIGSTTLYHLISPGSGVVLMVVITTLAVGLSLRHGPFVALLGLLGGFIMPVLLQSDPNSALQLFGYLALLQIGLICITRYRGWYWLTFATFLGGVLWSGLWICFLYNTAEAQWVALFLMVSTIAFLLGIPHALQENPEVQTHPLLQLFPWCTVLTAMALLVMLLGTSRYSTTEWCYFGILGLGSLILARIQEKYFPAPLLACAVSGLLLWIWHRLGLDHRSVEFLGICGGLGGVYGLGAYASLWKSQKPNFWGWFSAAGGLLFLFIGRYCLPVELNWSFWFFGIAAVYAIAALPLIPRRNDELSAEALAALITAATVAVDFGIQYAMETREIRWIWVGWCWSLQIPVLAGLMCVLKLRRLADLITFVQTAVSVLILLNPQMFQIDYGTHPLWNRLWILFGIPLMSSICARAMIGRWGNTACDAKSREGLSQGLELSSVFFGFYLTTLLVRHGFNPEFKIERTFRLLETGFYLNLWLLLAIVMKHLANRNSLTILKRCSLLIAWSGLGVTLISWYAIFFDFSADETIHPDWKWLNLGFVFFIPPLLLLTLGRMQSAEMDPSKENGFELAGWCTFTLACLVGVKRSFHEHVISNTLSWQEISTYPLIWGILAAIVLVLGLYFNRKWTQLIGAWLWAWSAGSQVILCYVWGNPVFRHIDTGWQKIFNGILYSFGGALVLSLISLRQLKQAKLLKGAIVAGIFAQISAFMLMTLEIRQWNRGAFLDSDFSTNQEQYTYSAAWIIFGIVLLVLGIVSRSKSVRLGSLAMMILSTLKVFVVDTRNLEDLWRVISFLGLGISLLVIVSVYQKFVFNNGNSGDSSQPVNQEK